jgi:hypothetical protein
MEPESVESSVPLPSDQEEKHEHPPPKPPYGVVHPHFKLIFKTLITFTGFCFLVHLGLVCTGIIEGGCVSPEVSKLSDEFKKLVRDCATMWRLGFVAMVVLTVHEVRQIYKLLNFLG